MTTEPDRAGVLTQLSSDASALNFVAFWPRRMEIDIEEQREAVLKKFGVVRNQARNGDGAIFELEVA